MLYPISCKGAASAIPEISAANFLPVQIFSDFCARAQILHPRSRREFSPGVDLLAKRTPKRARDQTHERRSVASALPRVDTPDGLDSLARAVGFSESRRALAARRASYLLPARANAGLDFGEICLMSVSRGQVTT
jgi:hypothetical protein